MTLRSIQLGGVLILCVLSTAGCLSIGGTITAENPETEARISSLEARVSSLEQLTIGTQAAAVPQDGRMEALPSPGRMSQ
jgi:hypothetical protein